MRRKPRRSGCQVRGCKRRVPRVCRPVRLCATHLLQRADAAFSRYIRERDGKCVMCGSTTALQCCHVHSRRYRMIRWNPLNAVAGCRKCHTFYTHRPLEWAEWIDDYLGPGVVSGLRDAALVSDPPDWKELAMEWVS